MWQISYGLTSIFSANKNNAFVCSHDFNIEHSALFEKIEKVCADVPFLSSSSKSDFHAFTRGGRVVVVDRNYKEIFHSEEFQGRLRGLTFDLHDNVFMCCITNKLKQIRCGGNESRDIVLDGIRYAYNVALHPTGEKVLVIDYNEKCCIYQVL